MYDIDLKVIKKGKGFWYIFLGIGILFAGIFTFALWANRVDYESIDSSTMSIKTIEKSEYDEGELYKWGEYTFVVDGMNYTCEGEDGYYVDPINPVLVHYSKEDPSNCYIDGQDPSGTDFAGLLAAFVMPAIFILLSMYKIVIVNKRVKQVKQLNEVGKLIKGMPYRMEETGVEVNENPIYRPVIDYKLPTGETVTLKGDGRFDNKLSDYDGLVDLVIDENNPNNYFIDFEINRMGGNLKSDFYINPNPPQPEVNTQDPYATNYGTEDNKGYYR